MGSASIALASGPRCESLFHDSALTIVDIQAEYARRPDDKKNGLVTDRLPITVETLSVAYRHGVFPWDVTPEGNGVWFSPPLRGILDFSELRIGNSDRKVLRRLEAAVERGELRVTFDTAFERVIQECAAQQRLRRDAHTGQLAEQGTWITSEIIDAYTAMFKAGRAHSVEIWKGDELVAGTYGTAVAGVYSGESMFHKLPEVAKLALMRMLDRLRSLGYLWIDTQVAPPDSTSLSVKWGAREISREEYLARLKSAAETPDRWPAR
jgi:leucyl/phenylalanyl-tRNA--protein transferase